jgi:hypothetical protein
MSLIEGPTLKRTFEQSGLEDSQDQNGTTTSGEGRKLVHLMQDADVDSEKTSLDSLPIEILIDIASYLSTSELLSFRLTNRTIEVALFNDFAAYYFAKKQFMLTAESLQCLVDISLHPKLSTVLEHVIISLDKYRLDNIHLSIPDNIAGHTKAGRVSRYRQGVYDQVALLNAGQDRVLLTQAFRNLKNLKTVGVRDFNSGKRWRDGEGAEWRAYGVNTVIRETGMKLDLFSGTQQMYNTIIQYPGAGTAMAFSAKTFSTVLGALGSSGATPENIEVLLRDRSHGLPDYAFHVPQYLAPKVAPLLAGLKTLLLTTDLGYLPMLNANPPQVTEPYSYVVGYALRHFLSLVPNLTHLRLNFQRGQARNSSAFLEWLASTDRHSGTQLLPKLVQLDLGMMEFDGKSVNLPRRVVGRFGKTLKGVSFWKTRLIETREQVVALEQDKELKPNWWAELLVQLPKVAPGLNSISVGCLSQQSRGQVIDISLNVSSAEGQKRPSITREYRGEDMRDLNRFKEMLENELVVSWPEDASSDESDDDQGKCHICGCTPCEDYPY